MIVARSGSTNGGIGVRRLDFRYISLNRLSWFYESISRGRNQNLCEGRGTLVALNKRICTLLGKYGIVRVPSCFDVNPVRGLLALT